MILFRGRLYKHVYIKLTQITPRLKQQFVDHTKYNEEVHNPHARQLRKISQKYINNSNNKLQAIINNNMLVALLLLLYLEFASNLHLCDYLLPKNIEVKSGIKMT